MYMYTHTHTHTHTHKHAHLCGYGSVAKTNRCLRRSLHMYTYVRWKCSKDNTVLEEIAQLPMPGYINALAFANSGRFLVAGVIYIYVYINTYIFIHNTYKHICINTYIYLYIIHIFIHHTFV